MITSPSKRADFSSGEITSGAENKRRDGLVKSDLEPRAREAFGALKGGKAMAYRDMLCLRARQALSRPVMANALKDAASDYTKRNIEITTVKSASSGAVSFNLETAVDHLNCSEKPEFTAVSGIQYRHQFSESATDVIARICGSLAALLLLAG